MFRALVLALLLLWFSSLTLQAATTPTMEVRKMVDSILAVLDRTDLDFAIKREEVKGLVQKYTDIDSVARRTLGVHWSKATREQQDRFAKLFVQVLEATYLHRIEEYSGGQVEYVRERVKEDKAIVDVRFVTDTLQVPVEYKMLLTADHWQIYDVTIENVSLVRTYRSSYGEIISKEGLDALLVKLEEKLAESAATGK